MMDKLTGFTDYFRKIPAAFLVAIVSVLALILFIPDEQAKTLAVFDFREKYRVYLGPTFLLTLSFCVARPLNFFMNDAKQRLDMKKQQKVLHKLTPEEKGYLVPYIQAEKNSIYVGMDDGVMAGLQTKGITYLAANTGDILSGSAFNLRPWARIYLEQNPHLLEEHVGSPMTPRQKLYQTYF
jgi:hypothetical protein